MITWRRNTLCYSALRALAKELPKAKEPLKGNVSQKEQNCELCIYCGSRTEITQDHVPPKSFFPKPRPSDLITVPSCRICNQDAGKDEDYFLATLMFSDAGVSHTGKDLWKQRLRRMYNKNLGLRGKIASNFSFKQIVTPSGIYLGRGMTIKFDETRLNRVVGKIVRGLYYFEFGQVLAQDIELMVLFLSTKARYDTAIGYVNQLGLGKCQWPGIFEYRYNWVNVAPDKSMWLIRFYGNTYFWAVSEGNSAQPA